MDPSTKKKLLWCFVVLAVSNLLGVVGYLLRSRGL